MDMKKIKLSPFWLAMIAAGGVLLVVFVVMVMPQSLDLKKQRGAVKRTAEDLKSAKEGTPSRADIDSWNKYKADVLTSYKQVTDFYTSSDKYLERWFPGILLGAEGNPSRDIFMSRYRDEGGKLEESLAKKEVKVGIDPEEPGKPSKFGFNWEAVGPGEWGAIGADELNVLRELQKRYWARQRLANVILNGGVKVNRIVDFRFFKKLHERLNNAPWEQYPNKPDETVHWQGVNAGQNGQPIGFQETDLPNELGKTLTFGFAIELPYSEVPKAIREILNPGNEAAAQERMLVNLIGTHVTIRDQNEPVVRYTFEQGNKQDEDAKKADALSKSGGDKPRPVLLAVTCQIVDFDPAKVKKFDKTEKTN
jgi:hypothetical protein